MSQQTLVVLGGVGTITGDTSATPNTVPVRDNAGGVTHAQVIGSELKSSAILTLAVSASKTTNFTLDATAIVWPCDATGGAFTATMPTAVGVTGRTLALVKTDASGNAVTISGGLIAASLATQGARRIYVSDGTSWLPLAS